MTDSPPPVLAQWWHELTEALDVQPDTTLDEVLDLAALAAHAVVRPAAPATTFLVGYAAGLAGGSREAEARARATAEALAQRHRDPADPA